VSLDEDHGTTFKHVLLPGAGEYSELLKNTDFGVVARGLPFVYSCFLSLSILASTLPFRG
jgi:hypothetical protein